MNTEIGRDVVEVSVYDGPSVELTGVVVESLRAATEVKLGEHFSEAAFLWNEQIDSLDGEQIKQFLTRLTQAATYAETLLSLAPLPEEAVDDE